MLETAALSRLALVVPTYNRAAFVDESLRRHLPLLSTHSIPIYISDNASNDETFMVVEKYKKEYPCLYYHCNAENLGPDKNFEVALSLPDSKYVWLLGDTSTFEGETLNKIMELTESKDSIDVIVLNDSGRVRNVLEKVFTDRNLLLRDLGWHMTQMSTLIYSCRLLQNANFVRFRDTNFIQTGIIFEYLANQPTPDVRWLPHTNITGFKVAGIPKIGWLRETFEIWMRRWPNFVMSLPAVYDLENKQYAIKTHNRLARVFSMSKLMRLRANGVLTFTVITKYLPVARQSVSLWTCMLAIVLCFVPKSIISFKR